MGGGMLEFPTRSELSADQWYIGNLVDLDADVE
jgi:hypothetical protein